MVEQARILSCQKRLLTNHDIDIKAKQLKNYLRQFQTVIPEPNKKLVGASFVPYASTVNLISYLEQKIPAHYRNTKLTIFYDIKMHQNENFEK